MDLLSGRERMVEGTFSGAGGYYRNFTIVEKAIKAQSRMSIEVDEFLYPVFWATTLSYNFI